VSGESLSAPSAPVSVSGTRWAKAHLLVPSVLAVLFLAFATLSFASAIVASLAGTTLVVLAAIDIERGIIPNRIVLPAAAVVLVANIAIVPSRAGEWTLAALLAGLVLAVPALFGRNWMGMGDAKLALLMGAALGWGVAGAVVLGLLCTFPVALFVLTRGGIAARKSTIPFGPFLALGALIVMFAPPFIS
jgi:prepilin signal peptidase PulO-like enzyme (type II secretory pathway)